MGGGGGWAGGGGGGGWGRAGVRKAKGGVKEVEAERRRGSRCVVGRRTYGRGNRGGAELSIAWTLLSSRAVLTSPGR